MHKSYELPIMLNVYDHSRDSAGMKYVYPVVSRRARGVSIGINLNTNNACNWACIYCQVPDLKRGGPPKIDLAVLEDELRNFLHHAITGDFLAKNAPPESKQLVDVAFSGNGEPTSAREFPAAVDIVVRVLQDFGLLHKIKLRLITNGSLLHRPYVRQGIERIGAHGGEIWFKVDRATTEGMSVVNGIRIEPGKVRKAILACAELAPTWIQTCLFTIDGKHPEENEFAAYLALLSSIRTTIQGVHLYGLARPSLQPQANRLAALNAASLLSFSRRIAALGIDVVCNP